MEGGPGGVVQGGRVQLGLEERETAGCLRRRRREEREEGDGKESVAVGGKTGKVGGIHGSDR